MIQIKQTIPKAQKDIIIYALDQRLVILKDDIKTYESIDKMGRTQMQSADLQGMYYEEFDILTLKALLQYDITVSMSELQHATFTMVNNIDYPKYTKD